MLSETATITEQEDGPPPDQKVFSSTENFTEVDASEVKPRDIIEEIKAACAECEAYNDGKGHFGSQWDIRVAMLLGPVYKALCLIGDDPDRLNIAIRCSAVKTTKATRKNPALIFMKIAAKPDETAEMKLCSSWAEILNEARAVPISVEGFAEWVKERKKQRGSTNAKDKRPEPSSTKDTNQLKLRLTGSDGPVDEILALPPPVHAELLDVLTTPGPQSERVQRVAKSLLLFADQLKKDEEVAKTAPPLMDEPDASPVTVEVADD